MAQGRDVHLGPGQARHLPHEAWHVVQQAQGRVRATAQAAGQPVNDDASLEHEADVMGARAEAVGATGADGVLARAHSGSPAVAQGRVLQAKLGFEIEMLALVDIAGRPAPG